MPVESYQYNNNAECGLAFCHQLSLSSNTESSHNRNAVRHTRGRQSSRYVSTSVLTRFILDASQWSYSPPEVALSYIKEVELLNLQIRNFL